MEIEVDYNPSPSKTFFISVSLNDKEAISFDHTTKGTRIIKQFLIEKKVFPKNKKVSGSWEALIIKNGKFIKKYKVKWLDLDKKDWVNNEIWETVLEKPLGNETKNKLLYYSRLISDNYNNLNSIKKEFNEFEKLLDNNIKKYL